MKRTIYIAGNSDILAELNQFEFPEAYHVNDLGNFDISDGEVVVVDKGDAALDAAKNLASRGIKPTRISYVDLGPLDDFQQAVGRPKHFFWSDAVALEDLPEDQADLVLMKSGVGFLDKNLSWGWRLPELGVIAGSYGSGKSTVGQYLAASFVDGPGRAIDASALLCSWEDIGSEVKANINCYQTWSGGERDLLKKIHFVRRGPNEDRLISWYKDLVRYYHERYNTKFFILDPWNEMDHVKDIKQSETDYVRDVMKDLRRLVDELKIILIVATHVPAKIIKGNGEIEPFKIAQAFGSSQFGNKADRGICILRAKKWDPTNGHTILRLDKAKVEGKMGIRGTLGLRFDRNKFRFEYDAYVTESVRDVWKD